MVGAVHEIHAAHMLAMSRGTVTDDEISESDDEYGLFSFFLSPIFTTRFHLHIHTAQVCMNVFILVV